MKEDMSEQTLASPSAGRPATTRDPQLTTDSEREKTAKAKKMMVWIGVAGIAMFFAAFTSAYIVLQADHFWVQDRLPSMFSISTGIIILSSLTVFLAVRSVKQGNTQGLTRWMK